MIFLSLQFETRNEWCCPGRTRTRVPFTLAAVLVLAGFSIGYPAPPYTIETRLKLERVVKARISPPGDQVLAVTERWTEKSYAATAQTLWLVSASGGPVQRLCEDADEVSQSRPAWSPDGRLVAYVAQRTKDTVLRVVRLDAQRSIATLFVCPEGESVDVLAWSPDSTRLALLLNRPIRPEPAKAAVVLASQSEHFSPEYPAFGERRVLVLHLADRAAREIARDKTFLNVEGSLIWSEPGALLVLGTPERPNPGHFWAQDRVVHRYDFANDRLTQETVTLRSHSQRMPIVSRDGRRFITMVGGNVGGTGTGDWRQTWRLVSFSLQYHDRQGRVASTMPGPDEIYIGRDPLFLTAPNPVAPSDDAIFFRRFERGSGRVMRFLSAMKTWSDLTSADKSVKDFSVSADGKRMAVVQGDAATPDDVWLIDLQNDTLPSRQLTRFGETVLGQYEVSPVKPLRWRSKDERFDVFGWLVLPPDHEPGQRHPMIVSVHGGPGVFFRNEFDAIHLDGLRPMPPALLAAHGYAVLLVNPRGDPGYGRAYQEALLEGWPFATINDILPGVDEVVRLGYADPGRLGIAGSSYGGWVAAFAISQTDRFKAASANDPVIDTAIAAAVAYRGERLGNYWLLSGFAGGHLFETTFNTVDPRTIDTPILLRFGLQSDGALFPSQFFVSGLPYFAYLHANGCPVEMILHPEESHGIQNWPTMRDYIARNLAWFDYWLKGEGSNPLKPPAEGKTPLDARNP